MKLIQLLALLGTASFFTGCASTEKSAPATSSSSAAPVTHAAPVPGGTSTAGQQEDTGSGLLMDRYKSGEIPGLNDPHTPGSTPAAQ